MTLNLSVMSVKLSNLPGVHTRLTVHLMFVLGFLLALINCLIVGFFSGFASVVEIPNRDIESTRLNYNVV